MESKIKENFLPIKLTEGIEEVLQENYLSKSDKLEYLGKIFNQITDSLFEGEFTQEQILHLNYVRDYVVQKVKKDNF